MSLKNLIKTFPVIPPFIANAPEGRCVTTVLFQFVTTLKDIVSFEDVCAYIIKTKPELRSMITNPQMQHTIRKYWTMFASFDLQNLMLRKFMEANERFGIKIDGKKDTAEACLNDFINQLWLKMKAK